MNFSRWLRPFRCGGLAAAFVSLAVAVPKADPGTTTLAAHEADIATVFHPRQTTKELGPFLDTLLPFSQLVAVMLTIAGLVRALQRPDPPLENIAHRLLLAGFIASLPAWRTLAEETGDAVAAAIGPPAVAGATLTATEAGSAPPAASALQTALRQLAEQWGGEHSPIGEILEEQRIAKSDQLETWLATGWNWAKGAYAAESGHGPSGWAAEAGTARALLLRAISLGTSACVLACLVALPLAETLRSFLFHGGSVLLPIAFAALGSHHWRGNGLRFLGGYVAVAAWPVAWAVAHLGTLAMARQALDILQKTASSALNPKPPNVIPSIALAAPWLSWSLLALLCVLTLAVCLWCLSAVVLAPWVLHRLCAGGVGWVAPTFRNEPPAPTPVVPPIVPAAGPPSGARISAAPLEGAHILTNSRRTPSAGGSVCGTNTNSVRALSSASTAARVKI